MKDGSGKVCEFASRADKKGMGVPGLIVLPVVLAFAVPVLVVLTMVLLVMQAVVVGGSWESTDLFLLENSFSSRSMCLSSLLAIVDAWVGTGCSRGEGGFCVVRNREQKV